MFHGITKLAEEGDEEGVRRMLEEGTPVDYIDNGRFNVTPLQVAARAGHLEIVKLLLARARTSTTSTTTTSRPSPRPHGPASGAWSGSWRSMVATSGSATATASPATTICGVAGASATGPRSRPYSPRGSSRPTRTLRITSRNQHDSRLDSFREGASRRCAPRASRALSRMAWRGRRRARTRGVRLLRGLWRHRPLRRNPGRGRTARAWPGTRRQSWFPLGHDRLGSHSEIRSCADIAGPADRPRLLEDGSWNDEEYDQPPCSGRMTHDSLETIVKRVCPSKQP